MDEVSVLLRYDAASWVFGFWQFRK